MMGIVLMISMSLLLVDVFAGRHSEALAEALTKIAGIFETRAIGYFRDVHIGRLQELSGMTEAELFDEVDRGKACNAFHLLVERRARNTHLCSHIVNIEITVGYVRTNDAVQTINELIAFVWLRGQFSQSLTDIDFVAHAVHLQDGADD